MTRPWCVWKWANVVVPAAGRRGTLRPRRSSLPPSPLPPPPRRRRASPFRTHTTITTHAIPPPRGRRTPLSRGTDGWAVGKITTSPPDWPPRSNRRRRRRWDQLVRSWLTTRAHNTTTTRRLELKCNVMLRYSMGCVLCVFNNTHTRVIIRCIVGGSMVAVLLLMRGCRLPAVPPCFGGRPWSP